jgi:putative peptidoglycan lipid II flippase
MGLTLAWTVPVTGIAQLAFTWWRRHRVGLCAGAPTCRA